jgi:hypothetical protein
MPGCPGLLDTVAIPLVEDTSFGGSLVDDPAIVVVVAIMVVVLFGAGVGTRYADEIEADSSSISVLEASSMALLTASSGLRSSSTARLLNADLCHHE